MKQAELELLETLQTELQPDTSSIIEVNGEDAESAAMTKATTRKGLIWVIGAFAICPCHLPFTLGLIATLLGGTGMGVVLQDYPVVAGAFITLVWLGATWRGFRYLRTTNNLKSCQLKQR
jgi:hypothetical protein